MTTSTNGGTENAPKSDTPEPAEDRAEEQAEAPSEEIAADKPEPGPAAEVDRHLEEDALLAHPEQP